VFSSAINTRTNWHPVLRLIARLLRDNLRTTRIDKFYSDKGRYPDSLDELVEKKYLRSVPFDLVADSSATWQAVAVPDGYKGVVYDIKSGASGAARDGKLYAEW